MNTATSSNIPLLELPEQNRGLGLLEAVGKAGKLLLPLASVDINAQVAERVAAVTVKQVFRNSYTEHLEAVYVFPLAAGCAVSSFNMRVGDRVVKGVVQERAEARRNYQQALDDGKRAALMEQERDDVFTVQVGNLPPGEEVTIEITYSERLPFFDDGKTEIRLPLVVSPRYIPGAALDREQVGDGIEPDTNLVPDASRITPPRLAPGLDPNVALKLSVELMLEDEAGSIGDLACSQHATKMSLAGGNIQISLSHENERLNRDFVLRWTMTDKTLKSSLLTFKGEDGQSYGMLSVLPPGRDGFLGAPRDVVFVLDRSGSMNGIKMTSAARACAVLINTLGSRDRFAVLAFDNVMEWMPTSSTRGGHGDRFIYADEDGIEKAERYLRTINSRGGTELDTAVRDALQVISARREPEGRTVSLVVLTDGEVGNESQILQSIQRRIGDARLFAVGIDTSVNAGLLKRLANLGGGTATFVEPGVQLEEALASVGREIGDPLVSDLQVDGLDLTIDRASLSPFRIPDTFAGRASVAFFKLSGNKGKVTVKGKYHNGKPFEQKIKARPVELAAIAQLWAKSYIVDLEDQFRVSHNSRTDLKKQIIDLAVKHSLLTKFTAFVVVDEAEIVNKTGDLRKVVQPVEQPDQWQMNQDAAFGSIGALGVSHQRPAAPGAAARGRSLSKAMMFDQAEGSQAKSIMNSPRKDAANDSWGSPAAGGGGNWGSPPAGADNDAWGAPAQQEAVQCDALSAPESGLAGAADAWSVDAEEPASGMWKAFSQEAAPAPELKAKKEAAAQPSAPAPAPMRQEPAPPPAAAPQPQMSAPVGKVVPPPGKADESQMSGSYGMGVRQQVFEVVVRQAIAGAPWREICAGPMQVNNISEQEVEAEVKRRQGLLQQPQGAWNQIVEFGKNLLGVKSDSATPSTSKDAAKIKLKLTEFLTQFTQAYVQVEAGQLPDAAALEAVRQNLVQGLATLEIGMQLPALQRFLRSQAIALISSLKDQNSDLAAKQSFWLTTREDFEKASAEIAGALESANHAQPDEAFWENNV